MNIAMLIAGGKGARMNQDIPKQFLNIHDKPVIVYTMQAFQRHPEVDAILIVCLDGWQEILKAYANQFNITKLKWVVTGGKNGQESICNGLSELEKECDGNDLVLIHDGIRPNVSQEIISNSIAECRLHGGGEWNKCKGADFKGGACKNTDTPDIFTFEAVMGAQGGREAENYEFGSYMYSDGRAWRDGAFLSGLREEYQDHYNRRY